MLTVWYYELEVNKNNNSENKMNKEIYEVVEQYGIQDSSKFTPRERRELASVLLGQDALHYILNDDLDIESITNSLECDLFDKIESITVSCMVEMILSNNMCEIEVEIDRYVEEIENEHCDDLSYSMDEDRFRDVLQDRHDMYSLFEGA